MKALIVRCVESLTATFQIKLLNSAFFSALHKMFPFELKDNEGYLRLFLLYAFPINIQNVNYYGLIKHVDRD